MLSLMLSLLFAVAQLIAGTLVSRVLLRRGTWRSPRGYLLLLIALWFVCSGLAELVVSGAEAAYRVWGTPAAGMLPIVKNRVDAALLVATLVLALALVAFPILRGRLGAGGSSG